MVPYSYVNGQLVLMFGNGTTRSLDESSPVFAQVVQALKDNEDEKTVLGLLDVKSAVAHYVRATLSGYDVNEDGKVYNTATGKEVHTAIANRVSDFMRVGLPFTHLLNFMAKIDENPSYGARNELFDFLEHRNLPITEDGCFLAYKAVDANYLDKYTRTIRNNVGDKPAMERPMVDDDRRVACSAGLHVGAIEYVYQYGHGGNGDHIMIVKVNPKDVVAVPYDCECTKMRVSTYEVVQEFSGELTGPLYAKRQDIDKAIDDFEDEDDEYDDDNDYYDDDDDEYQPVVSPHRQQWFAKNYRHNKRGPDGKFVKK
jgi:hypothetical protein